MQDSTEETLMHRESVARNIFVLVNALQDRAVTHDRSKLLPPEKATFDAFPRDAVPPVGTTAYEKQREALGAALAHHYAVNRHHPEFHANGLNDMTLVDIIEMYCDWMARIQQRQPKNPDAASDSFTYCQQRFGVSEQLHQVFLNTFDTYFKTQSCTLTQQLTSHAC